MKNQEKIKVLELIDEAKVGGGQIHLLLLTKYLDKNKYDVYVACEPEGFLVDELKKIQIPVLPIYISNKLRISSIKCLISIYQKYNFDIIHTHGGTAGFWGRLTALFVRRKPILIHTFHGIHYLNLNIFKKYIFILIDRILSKITAKNIFVCESDYKKGIEAKISSQKNSIVIQNGIDVENYIKKIDRNTARAKFAFKDEFVFGNVGRLHKQKGQMYLIKAFAELRKKYSNVLLAIVGDGELYEELRKLTKDLKIDDKVLFLGSRNDVADFLYAIDVFVLPSLWEGQPLTIFEAMAASKPIIATSIDGVREILTDMKNALLCPPSDVRALSESMERLYKDNELASELARESRKNVINGYSAHHTAEKISNLYLQLYRKFKNLA